VNPAAIQTVIFDCDGVLFDTTRANTLFYNRLLGGLGLPEMTPDQFAYCHMHTADEALRFLFGDKGLTEAAQKLRRETGYRDLIPEMQMEPDLIEVLDALRPGRRTAVATNRTDTMQEVLEVHGLSGRFDLVMTAQDVERPKPAPDMILKVLAAFGLSPDQALYVGDSALDEAAAEGSGVPFVAFRNPSLRAAAHVERLSDILGLVEA
jgi:HAD superfamily hydrolase (TIGR01509 family)